MHDPQKRIQSQQGVGLEIEEVTRLCLEVGSRGRSVGSADCLRLVRLRQSDEIVARFEAFVVEMNGTLERRDSALVGFGLDDVNMQSR